MQVSRSDDEDSLSPRTGHLGSRNAQDYIVEVADDEVSQSNQGSLIDLGFPSGSRRVGPSVHREFGGLNASLSD
jgi:hypothetical protein